MRVGEDMGVEAYAFFRPITLRAYFSVLLCTAPSVAAQMPERKYKTTLRTHRSHRIEMARKVRQRAAFAETDNYYRNVVCGCPI